MQSVKMATTETNRTVHPDFAFTALFGVSLYADALEVII